MQEKQDETKQDEREQSKTAQLGSATGKTRASSHGDKHELPEEVSLGLDGRQVGDIGIRDACADLWRPSWASVVGLAGASGVEAAAATESASATGSDPRTSTAGDGDGDGDGKAGCSAGKAERRLRPGRVHLVAPEWSAPLEGAKSGQSEQVSNSSSPI